jgi:hypothetical protein
MACSSSYKPVTASDLASVAGGNSAAPEHGREIAGDRDPKMMP